MNARVYRFITQTLIVVIIFAIILLAGFAGQIESADLIEPEYGLEGWRTNTAKSLIGFDELVAGGPEKDGIAALEEPRFEALEESYGWLSYNAPVIAVVINETARAYPLAVMLWHEIVNDTLGGKQIAVTYSPLSNSVAVYERKIGREAVTFGVSGMLRNSDMVMYDRVTESLFQQFTGVGLVGDFAGESLKRLNCQTISLQQFAKSYPDGTVLSADTGYDRDYGENPYVGYDDISNVPFMFTGLVNGALSPMERVVAINFNGVVRAYPFYITRTKGVINDHAGDEPIVIFHAGNTVSAVDCEYIRYSRPVGSTGVFSRKVGKHNLTFFFDGINIVDQQTRSTWDVTGKATRGVLRGERLTPIIHGDYFAFAWLTFYRHSEICR